MHDPSDMSGEWPGFSPGLEEYGPADARSGLAAGWSVPWSDLMMVMFILFVVMFVYVTTHRDVSIMFRAYGEDAATAEVDPLEGLIGRLTGDQKSRALDGFFAAGGPEMLFKSELSGVSVMREGAGRLRIVLRGDTFFAAGGSVLNPEAGMYLKEISDLLRLSTGAIQVIGYASEGEVDSVAGFTLSSARATAVAAHLIEGLGVEAARFTVSGRSIHEPEVPSTAAMHENVNRRVEIIIRTDGKG